MALNSADNRRYDKVCPNERILKRFAAGKISNDEIDAIGAHLDYCFACQSVMANMESSSDSLIAHLRKSDVDLAQESAYQRLQLWLREMPNALGGSPNNEPSHTESDPMVECPIPLRLGQYELSEKIGQGSMGTVYRARHVKLKRDVALKLLSPKRLNHSEAVERFSREMEAIGKLDDHPNIVRARDAGEFDGHHFLVMDYVEGIDMAHLLCRMGPIHVPDACELVRQVALALEYAHENGIVHRDVKPSNLLLSRSGEVKLLDLGLVAFCREAETESPGDFVVGTADYMAPEQWTRSEQADIRADVYSLGCTLYMLLVGHAPYANGNKTLHAKMTAHLNSSVPSVRTLRPTVPAEVDAVLTRMLAKKPADRYERPAEVVAALEAFTAQSDLAGLVARAKLPYSDTDRIAADGTSVNSTSLHLAIGRRPRMIASVVVGILIV